MKKILVILLLGFCAFSNIIHAERVIVDDLQINIMNLGTDNCSLVKQRFLNGRVFESQLPWSLPTDGQRYYFTVTGEGKINVELTYQCGDQKKATLQILQYRKPHHKHNTIDFHLLDVIDIFEQHSSSGTLSSELFRKHTGHKYPGKLAIYLSH